MTGKTGGGPGSNQYRTRGSSRARAHEPQAPKLDAGQALALRRCGDVWGTDCDVRVSAPDWSHDDHPANNARYRISRDPNTPPDVLRAAYGLSLDDTGHSNLASFLAHNPNTPSDILDRLLDKTAHRSIDMENLAQHPNSSAELLESLAHSTWYLTRLFVSANPHTPPDALTKLSRDDVQGVRWNVVENHNTPAAVLLDMASYDPDPDVRKAAFDSLPEHMQAIFVLGGEPDGGLGPPDGT